MTNDTSCQTDFQSEIGRPRYNDADHLISALIKYIKSLEKQLDEKQKLFYKIFIVILIATSLLVATIKLIKVLLKISILMRNLK